MNWIVKASVICLLTLFAACVLVDFLVQMAKRRWPCPYCPHKASDHGEYGCTQPCKCYWRREDFGIRP